MSTLPKFSSSPFDTRGGCSLRLRLMRITVGRWPTRSRRGSRRRAIEPCLDTTRRGLCIIWCGGAELPPLLGNPELLISHVGTIIPCVLSNPLWMMMMSGCYLPHPHFEIHEPAVDRRPPKLNTITAGVDWGPYMPERYTKKTNHHPVLLPNEG